MHISIDTSEQPSATPVSHGCVRIDVSPDVHFILTDSNAADLAISIQQALQERVERLNDEVYQDYLDDLYHEQREQELQDLERGGLGHD
jgi:hypothetical protein